jgi:sigma-B regulation protein RsbU (phosphoserine phosphatase)
MNQNDEMKITKVLLVDDQLIVGESVKRMLAEREKYEYHFCQEPANAVQTAAELEPEIILQDLVMPEVNGLMLVKFYRGHPKLKDVPVIILTSKADAETKKELFEKGATDYLVKMPDQIELLARIDMHVDNYRVLQDRNKTFDALQSELDKAGKYCMSLLPDTIDDDKIGVDWKFIPSEQLGGDSFGYHWIDDENFAMYLLDVCGHGVGAALMSVSALNVLRTETLPDTDFKDPISVLTAMNKSFQMADHNDMYFTMWYGVFNTKTRKIAYGSAGHPPSLLINPDGSVDQLMNENFIIGGIPEFPYTSTEVDAKPGAKLFIYSDGAYEIIKPDGTLWEMEEFIDFVAKSAREGSKEIDDLYNYIKKLGAKDILDDDFSMVRVELK